MNLVEKARVFATAAHTAFGQKRKYTNEDYIVHPAEVVQILFQYVHDVTEEMLAAAWLHDVCEDTSIPLSLILSEFGPEVYNLVRELTDVHYEGNRAARKMQSRLAWKSYSHKSKTIKLGDIISNTKTIALYDPKFAIIYFDEIGLLLPILADGGNLTLHRIAQDQIINR